LEESRVSGRELRVGEGAPLLESAALSAPVTRESVVVPVIEPTSAPLSSAIEQLDNQTTAPTPLRRFGQLTAGGFGRLTAGKLLRHCSFDKLRTGRDWSGQAVATTRLTSYLLRSTSHNLRLVIQDLRVKLSDNE
jgi:hypothetical protein